MFVGKEGREENEQTLGCSRFSCTRKYEEGFESDGGREIMLAKWDWIKERREDEQKMNLPLKERKSIKTKV